MTESRFSSRYKNQEYSVTVELVTLRGRMTRRETRFARYNHVHVESADHEGYAKPSLKKCRPIAARNEDEKVFSGRL
jgi:hypothetical protein